MRSRRNIKNPSQKENLLPEKQRIANNPPTLNQKVYQLRRYRHVIAGGGTTGSYQFGAETVSDFGVNLSGNPFMLQSISAWAFSDPTVPVVTLTLTDNQTKKSFTDSAQIGQPSAKVSYKYPLSVRQHFYDGSETETITNISFTTGAQVIVDIIVSILV